MTRLGKGNRCNLIKRQKFLIAFSERKTSELHISICKRTLSSLYCFVLFHNSRYLHIAEEERTKASHLQLFVQK